MANFKCTKCDKEHKLETYIQFPRPAILAEAISENKELKAFAKFGYLIDCKIVVRLIFV